MRCIVDQLAIQHRCHLVNAVGEQEAAIKYRDLGLCHRHKRTVHVSDLVQAFLLSDTKWGDEQYRRIVKGWWRRLASVRQNLRQKLLRAIAAWLTEKVNFERVFDDFATVHEDDAMRD